MSVAPDRGDCPASRHGTRTAYTGHGCRCRDARDAHARYNRAHLAGRSDLAADRCVDATGSRRRIQALYALGHRERDLAARLGYARTIPFMHHRNRRRIYSATAGKITALYDALSMTPGPSQKLRERAPAWGWHPPLAWDDADIDDPDCTPASDSGEHVLVDEVAVARAMAGRLAPGKLYPEERRAVVARLARTGLSSTAIAERTGLDVARVESDRDTLRSRRTRTGGTICP